MAKTDFQSHDEYIATFPADVQKILRQVRATIAKAVPDGEEATSYQLPAFKVGGKAVLYYAAFTKHWSFSCPPSGLHKAFAKELKPYTVTKSAVQFPLGGPVPVKLLAAMAKFRADEARKAAAKR